MRTSLLLLLFATPAFAETPKPSIASPDEPKAKAFEQAQLVRESLVQMIVLDPNGELLGFFNLPSTPEPVTALKRRAKEGPFLTTEQVLAGLEAKVTEDMQLEVANPFLVAT